MPQLARDLEVAFLAFVLPRMLGETLRNHPLDPAKWTAKQMDMVLADVAEWGGGLSKEQLSALDTELERAKLPSLTSMINSSHRRARRILRRGRVNSDDEYNLLNGLLCDTASSVLSLRERQLAESMIGTYVLTAKAGNAAL